MAVDGDDLFAGMAASFEPHRDPWDEDSDDPADVSIEESECLRGMP